MNLEWGIPDFFALFSLQGREIVREVSERSLARIGSYCLIGENARYDLDMGSFWLCDKCRLIIADRDASAHYFFSPSKHSTLQ